MAVSDWNTANSERAYPFQENPEASGVASNEILDARFFIVNPQKEQPIVWLAEREETDTTRTYIFRTSALESALVFVVEKKPYAQCVWNQTDDSWNGYCVFGGQNE